MVIAELRAQFPFGVLLVTDEKSAEPIPDWSSEDRQITSTPTAMAIKIRHEVDGPAIVRVWDESPPATSNVIEVDTVHLKSPSGVLRVSTATGEHAVRIPIPGGTARIKVLASSHHDPGDIDLVVMSGLRTTERERAAAPVPSGG